MDELIIGEKKYISSKQAAKATGYAKDYIGQLCREGRVPARLVGRSWYVLESAICDHRFGEPKETMTNEADKGNSTSTAPTSGWESPRYMAADAEVLPSVNRLRSEGTDNKLETGGGGEEGVSQGLQDTWQAWFDKFEPPPITDAAIEESTKQEVQEEVAQYESDVMVPIHPIHNSHYRALPVFEEPVPHRRPAEVMTELAGQQGDGSSKRGGSRRGKRVLGAIKLVGVLCALVMVVAAAVGSGYLDKYLISYDTARIISGISLYQK